MTIEDQIVDKLKQLTRLVKERLCVTSIKWDASFDNEDDFDEIWVCSISCELTQLQQDVIENLIIEISICSEDIETDIVFSQDGFEIGIHLTNILSIGVYAPSNYQEGNHLFHLVQSIIHE